MFPRNGPGSSFHVYLQFGGDTIVLLCRREGREVLTLQELSPMKRGEEKSRGDFLLGFVLFPTVRYIKFCIVV